MSTTLTSPYIFAPGADVSGVATADIIGETFVKISGNRDGNGSLSVAPAGAGDRALGVAAWSAASGQIVRVARGGVVKVTAGAAITAGAAVQSDANGKAIPAAAGTVLGFAVNGAANGAVGEVAFYA